MHQPSSHPQNLRYIGADMYNIMYGPALVARQRTSGRPQRVRNGLTPIILNYLLPVRAHTSYGLRRSRP